jgi:hypothetical protein
MKKIILKSVNLTNLIQFLSKMTKLNKCVYFRLNESHLSSDLYYHDKTALKFSKISTEQFVSSNELTSKNLHITLPNASNFIKLLSYFNPKCTNFELTIDSVQDGLSGNTIDLVALIKISDETTEIEYGCGDHNIEYPDLPNDDKIRALLDTKDSILNFNITHEKILAIQQFFNIDNLVDGYKSGAINIKIQNGKIKLSGSKYNTILSDTDLKDFSGVNLATDSFSFLDNEDYNIFIMEDKVIFVSDDSNTQIIIAVNG